eukprot:TRINITY_DN32385_c0_g1_i1.p1 TRINITY_DN32385_c0_g1~~TRINITY_DN32385_c0_g1_i1.p1  ORF type:complete len:997 (+),score=137.58 TRINITY_DN32385_c0_g1_i1:195-3185(+)
MAPVQQRQRQRVRTGRFHEEEKLSFGRWSFLSSKARLSHRHVGEAFASKRSQCSLRVPEGQCSLGKVASAPTVMCANSDCDSGIGVGGVGLGNRAGKCGAIVALLEAPVSPHCPALRFDVKKVQGMLESMLPSREVEVNLSTATLPLSLEFPSRSKAEKAETLVQPWTASEAPPSLLSSPGSRTPPSIVTPVKLAACPIASPLTVKSTDEPQSALEEPTQCSVELSGEHSGSVAHMLDWGVPPSPLGRNPHAALSCGVVGKFQKVVLEQFRQRLLARFPSLHDAFSRMNHGVDRDRSMTAKEFRVALERLGAGDEDVDEIFVAMDSNCDGGVTLSEFLHALVDVSPEALLWELRCRLLRMRIGPSNLGKALELVQWPQHGWMSRATKVKRRTTRHLRDTERCGEGKGCDRVSGERFASGEVENAVLRGDSGRTASQQGPSVSRSSSKMSASAVSIDTDRGSTYACGTSFGNNAASTGTLRGGCRRAAVSAPRASTTRPSSAATIGSCSNGNVGPVNQPRGGDSWEDVRHESKGRPLSASSSAAALQTSTTTHRRRSSFQLSRGDWLKLCTSIYLTLFEAERLFTYLSDGKDFVDLHAMFETLRTKVEPDVSLEQFTTKAMARFETLGAAFSAFCEESGADRMRVLYWPGFHALAVSLGVNDSSAAKLWRILTRSPLPLDAGRIDGDSSCDFNDLSASTSACGGNEKRGPGVSEKMFLQELSLWGPDTALETLRAQLCERFGSLAEARRGLERRLSNIREVSPKELDACLRALGISNCDAERALSVVASNRSGPVSLDAAIEKMRAARGNSKGEGLVECARSKVKNETLPLWEQLRTVQQDLRSKSSVKQESQVGAVGVRSRSLPTSMPARRPPVEMVDKTKFSEAMHGAVKSAETCHTKWVLANAHRQILQLQERWATPSSTGANANSSWSTPTPSRRSSKPSSRPNSRPSSRPNSRPPTAGHASMPCLKLSASSFSGSMSIHDAEVPLSGGSRVV